MKKGPKRAEPVSSKKIENKFKAPLKKTIMVTPDAAPRSRAKRLLYKHLHNLKLILESTNATMIFKHGDKGYLCCYCTEGFDEPKDLKEHTLTKHKNEEKFYGNLNAKGPSVLLVKLDITDLQCMICATDIYSLEEAFFHMEDKHKKNFHRDIKNQIFPFKFNDNELKCCQCSDEVVFATFRALHEHMNKHYRYFICTECDAGFINQLSLSRHSVTHTKGSFPCRQCSEVFENVFRRSSHELRSHSKTGYSSRCHFCSEGFREHSEKKLHLATVHGIATPKYDCRACDKSFFTNSVLRAHVRRVHLLEKKHKCSECDKAFFDSCDLKKHILTHTGAKDFKCDVCSKCFVEKSTLTQHMRIHTNDRRFKCPMCDKAYVQKPSLTWHMKASHGKPTENTNATKKPKAAESLNAVEYPNAVENPNAAENPNAVENPNAAENHAVGIPNAAENQNSAVNPNSVENPNAAQIASVAENENAENVYFIYLLPTQATSELTQLELVNTSME